MSDTKRKNKKVLWWAMLSSFDPTEIDALY